VFHRRTAATRTARGNRLGGPGLSEPQWWLISPGCSRRTTPSTEGSYPLGSCTMKNNPSLNEKAGALPASRRHPSASRTGLDGSGALELIDTLAHWRRPLTG